MTRTATARTQAMASLLGAQFLIARFRKESEGFEAFIQNTPVLLMRAGEILHDALDATRVAEDDLIAKLREANVLDFSQVRAVVVEATGDISVLHGPTLEKRLIDRIHGFEGSGLQTPANQKQ